MTWQELKSLRKAGDNEQGFLKAVCESKDGKEYEVDVIKGWIDVNEVRDAADALDEGTTVYVNISFKRHPHPTKIKIGEWD